MSARLKILAFTDFHGSQEMVRKAKEQIAIEKPDFVIVAGDIINHDSDMAKQLLQNLGEMGRPVYFVPGNMDNRSLGDWAGEGNVQALHGRCVERENVSLIGLGGSPHGPFKTVFEYDEEEAARILESARNSYVGGVLILVSHCPPKDTKVDHIPGGEHVGSSSVRKFIEQVHPRLVISGHVHESQGMDEIGESTIINTGPAKGGHYARIAFDRKVLVEFAKL